MFEDLKRQVFPAIVNGKPEGPPIRVWVPGCSTGQEAYSIAMALLEFLDTAEDQATDPDLRHRPRRPGVARQGARRPLPGEHRGGSQPRAAAAVLHQGRSPLPHPEERARPVRLRAAERHRRSAVLARRSGHLPQRADLHVAAAAGTAAAGVSLRAESRRLPRPGPGRNRRLVRRPVRARRIARTRSTARRRRRAGRRSRSWRTTGCAGTPSKRPGIVNQPPGDFQREADRLVARPLRAAQRARESRLRGAAVPRPHLAVPRGAERPADHQHPAHGQGRACSWSCAAR